MQLKEDIGELLKELNTSLDRDLNSIFYNNAFLYIKLKEDHQKIKHQILTCMNQLYAMPSPLSKRYKPSFKTQLPLIWKNYQALCIKWFYEWKLVLEESKNKTDKFQDVNVEFRVLKSKLSKMLKTFHKFYYQILEYITCHFDTSLIIPIKLIGDLNLEGLIQKMPHLAQIRKLLQPKDKAFTLYVVLTFYHCLLYLGKIRYHQTLLEDSSFMHKGKLNEKKANIKSLNLKKAEKYWLMAANLVPSMGETYKQLSKVPVTEHDYCKTLYLLVRRHFARTNNNEQDSRAEIIAFFKERKWAQTESSLEGKNLLHTLLDIMRYYTFIKLQKQNSRDAPDEETGSIVEFKFDVLLSLQTPPLLMNGTYTIHHIITLIGIFSMSKKSQSPENMSVSAASQLTRSNELFLEFILDVVFQITLVVNKHLKKNVNIDIKSMISFLAIVRLINCWIKSDTVVLSFAHRYRPICESMCEFLGILSKLEPFCSISHTNKRPKRPYLFEEDVMLREFTCIKCSLTDFDDTEISTMNNVANRLIGHAPKANVLTEEEEFHLRLRAVVTSMKRFLKQNKFGIKVKLDNMYLPAVKSKTVTSSNQSVDMDVDNTFRTSLTVMPPANNNKNVKYKVTKPTPNKEKEYTDDSFLDVVIASQPAVVSATFRDTRKPFGSDIIDDSSSLSQILTQGQIPSDMLKPSQSQRNTKPILQLVHDSDPPQLQSQLQTQPPAFGTSGWFEGDETPMPLGQQHQQKRQHPPIFHTSTQL